MILVQKKNLNHRKKKLSSWLVFIIIPLKLQFEQLLVVMVKWLTLVYQAERVLNIWSDYRPPLELIICLLCSFLQVLKEIFINNQCYSYFDPMLGPFSSLTRKLHWCCIIVISKIFDQKQSAFTSKFSQVHLIEPRYLYTISLRHFL